MKVKILQKGGNRDNKLDIAQAVMFYAKELMSTRLMNTLTIRVALRVTGRSSKTTTGHVHMLNNGSAAQKVFNINIDRNATLVDQLQILAHEMIHVEQIARGRYQLRKWKSDGIYHARWEGKDLGNWHDIPYREQPWEIEAYDNQLDLAGKFIDAAFGAKLVEQIAA